MDERSSQSNSGSTIIYWAIFIFVVGVLVAIAIPNRIGPRRSGPAWEAHCCLNILRQIDAAACQFALEHQLTNGNKINFPNDLTPYIKLNSAGSIPPCPSGGAYHIGRVGKVPTCTLSTATPAHKLQ